METLLKIFAFIFAVFTLVVVHEYGHFLLARIFNVRIIRFSIGFGRALFKWHGHSGCEYVIAAIPLGGYVKMLDSREMTVTADETNLAFDVKPVWQRLLIILAGPIMNVLFAFIMFWIILSVGFNSPKPIIAQVAPGSIAQLAGLNKQDEIVAIDNKETKDWQKIALVLFTHIGDKENLPIKIQRLTAKTKNEIQDLKSSIGIVTEEKNFHLNLRDWHLNEWQPDPLQDLGIEPYQPQIPVIISKIMRFSPAANAGLRAQDEILSIEAKKFQDWKSMIEFIKAHPLQKMKFVVKRKQDVVSLVVTAGQRYDAGWKKIGYLGIKSQPAIWPENTVRNQKYAPLRALGPAWQQVYDFLHFNMIVVQKLFTGKISFHVFGGPISIFQSATMALQHGLIAYCGFLAMLSLMLAFVNLLPFPALDGGYVWFLLFETIRRRPLSAHAQALLLRLGLILLVMLMLQGMFNDLQRLFS